MEFKKGDKVIKIPAWVLVAGVTTIGAIAKNICDTVVASGKKSK